VASESRTTVAIALAANVGVTVVKIAAGIFGGSSALLSEGAHSVSDTANELFLLASVRRSDLPADSRHPFGHGAERFFWALIAAVGIFVAGGGFSLFEAYRSLVAPPGRGSWTLEYAVLAVSAVLEGTSLLRAARQVRREAGAAGRRVTEHVVKSPDPAVKTVASEDAIAVIGLVVAATGIGLHQATGNGRWEAAASAVIGLLLLFVAFVLARDNMSLLVGEAVEPDRMDAIRGALLEHPMVENVVELLTRYLGPEEVLVAVRVEVTDGHSSGDVVCMSADLDRALKALDPQLTQVFIDATTAEEREGLERRRSGSAEA
jgi:cation diffusion facilitator family transporter